MISRAKGDALTRLEYSDAARSYPEEVTAQVWEKYDATLRREHALDFDDLLIKTLTMLKSHPPVLEAYRTRFLYMHVDEYQDTNRVQYEIARLLAGERGNICVVGDVDQCLVGSTKVTMANGTTKQISKVQVGDMVQSCFGSGDFRPSMVTRTHKNMPHGELVTVRTKNGNILTSTKNHMHFAGYRIEMSPQTYMVYLMKKDSIGWRVGVTQVYTKGQKVSVPGFVQRCNHEHADAVWVISTHSTEQEARIQEYTLSLQYQIPTLPFVPRKGRARNGYVHDKNALEHIFETFDTQKSAECLMKNFGLHSAFPHHRPRSEKSDRKNLTITLCGDRRGKTPMHVISMGGSDTATAKLLRETGLSVRPSKKGKSGWRFETVHSSYTNILNIITTVKKLVPEVVVCSQARFGKQTKWERGKNSLPFIPAESVRPGMVMFTHDGSYDVVESVQVVPHQETYDIDVEHTHNFIANSIVTHNSIYGWRGAEVRNILMFERHFPGTKIVMLEENYRSTQTIITASNDIIEKNINRPEKKVFTKNEEGELISLYAAMNAEDEAEHVALTAKNIIKSGIAPSAIAVLYRTNFQSRALEEAFINMSVPYQLLGTRFFERKEIKDVLSYLRLALNPDSVTDLTRVINEPTRGVGKISILKIVEGKRGDIKGKALEGVMQFERIMEDIRREVAVRPLHESIKFIMERTGIEATFKDDGEEGQERLENLRELVTIALRYSDQSGEEAINKLLEDAALEGDQDEMKKKEEKDAVRLMTIHASKGLEFPYVFITGLEEGLFPHERFDEGKTDTEEERRLFYVALTRAEKKVHLSFAHMRMIFGSERINVPSSFLADIRPELLEGSNPHETGFERTVFLD
jgi:DNA helicase-2/ATP-dependent DNA helicase PcrA